MRSKLTKVKPTDMTTLISAYESDDDDDDGSLAIETGASTIHSSIASVSTAVIDHQDIITTTTTDEPRKKQRCIDAIPPFPPSVKPAANTVENIKYYMDAMKRHDFRLIDVRHALHSSSHVFRSAALTGLLCYVVVVVVVVVVVRRTFDPIRSSVTPTF